MMIAEDDTLPPPPDILPSGNVSEKENPKDSVTDEVKTSEANDIRLKRQDSKIPAADSRYVYGLYPPYSPFPPPGHYLYQFTGMGDRMNHPQGLMDPNAMAPWQQQSSMAYPPQPYAPHALPFPPSPYYSDRNDTRTQCAMTPSPAFLPPVPRPYEQGASLLRPDSFIVKEQPVKEESSRHIFPKPHVVEDSLGETAEVETEETFTSARSEETSVGESEETTNSSCPTPAVYVKSKMPISKDLSERRKKKNTFARKRAVSKRKLVAAIEAKPEHERTEEEKKKYDHFVDQREKKNQRSRERALEKKAEIQRILAKPKEKRTKFENDYLVVMLDAKQRKNEGDRIRRLKGRRARGRQQCQKPPLTEEEIYSTTVLDSFHERQQREWHMQEQKGAAPH